MKKTTLFMFIVSTLLSCKQINNQNSSTFATNNSKVPFQISLNGYSITDADKMVTKFETGRTSDDISKTNIWLSKGFIHNIYQLLLNENGDGIRIYFARNVNDDDDNVIIVSTRDVGVNSTAPSGANHIDYFEHTASFLTSSQSNGDVLVDHGPSTTNPSVKGALFYNPTSPCTSSDTCSILPDHDLECGTAYLRVKNFSLLKNDTKNTTSEFFGKKLIEKLDNELQKTKDPSGLRIYFAKRIKDQKLVFVIATTILINGYQQDYYKCFPKPVSAVDDNGEQCPNNCYDVTWQ
jgi:hypothetical protein